MAQNTNINAWLFLFALGGASILGYGCYSAVQRFYTPERLPGVAAEAKLDARRPFDDISDPDLRSVLQIKASIEGRVLPDDRHLLEETATVAQKAFDSGNRTRLQNAKIRMASYASIVDIACSIKPLTDPTGAIRATPSDDGWLTIATACVDGMGLVSQVMAANVTTPISARIDATELATLRAQSISQPIILGTKQIGSLKVRWNSKLTSH